MDWRHRVDVARDAIVREIPVLCLSETFTEALFQADSYAGVMRGKPRLWLSKISMWIFLGLRENGSRGFCVGVGFVMSH